MAPERWLKIERLYHAALDYAPDQRHRYLLESCGRDEALRREIEELLAREERSRDFLEKSALEIAAQHERTLGRSHESANEYRLAQGARLGPYEILKPLGAGGMGEIYYARDNRLGRAVALKILSGRMLNQPAIRGRLESEARAISSLNHPNICTLHDIGQENEVDYLVMEFVEGQTLAQRLKKGTLPYPELLQIAIQVSEALDYAHQHGVVHRDLKPGNIMLTERGVKLVDFGLARWQQEAQEFSAVLPGSVISSLTLTGVVLGTPQYMAPEQIERGAVDGRTDIFALGAVLFEMATGRKAFEGKTSSEVTRAILKSEPRDISSVQRSIPAALDYVVRRCLRRSPAERWQSAGELAEELRRLEDRVEDRRPKPLGGRGRMWSATAVVAILTAGLIGRATVARIQIRHDLRLTILHSFNGHDGKEPMAGVVAGKNGTLYGTTSRGGVSGNGTVFALAPPATPKMPWIETVLHSFTGGSDGFEPNGGLIVGESGELYGTTRLGGAFGDGTVFELVPAATQGQAWTEKSLYNFTRQNGDGSGPLATLVMDKNGVLYGTTEAGGAPGPGYGTVFELKPPETPGAAWTEKVLYRFTYQNGDGAWSWADLLVGKDGELYGTTFAGTSGIGTVFKLTPPSAAGRAWTETVLHRFTGENGDGTDCAAGLVVDGNGTLYGTTTEGTPGLGSVFELKPPAAQGGNWTETMLHQFTGRNGDGSDAATGLAIGKNGVLYGTTLRGGASGKGMIFQLTPPTTAGGAWTETILYSFTGQKDGIHPKSAPRLYLDSSGTLYGTTINGGASNFGTVFRLSL